MATPLTTMARVKEWLQITNSANDSLLTRMIQAFSDAVANEINRDLGSQTYTETRDGNGSKTLMFSAYPVTQVQSLMVDGVSIPVRATYGKSGYVFTPTKISLVGEYAFTNGEQNVVLQTVAGYAQIPTEVEQAVIEWIADRYASRDRIGIQSKSLAGENISFALNDIPDPVLAILRPYRKVIPN